MNRSRTRAPRRAALLLALGGLSAALGTAVQAAGNGSRIVATGGASAFEGAAGGGLVPWALLSGYGDHGEVGAAAFASTVRVDDFSLAVAGASGTAGCRACPARAVTGGKPGAATPIQTAKA